MYKFLRKTIVNASRLMAEAKDSCADRTDDNEFKGRYEEYKLGLNLMIASAKALMLFIFIRLVLGLFGMDLYEVYWWFACGFTAAIYKLSRVYQDISFKDIDVCRKVNLKLLAG